MHKDGYHLDITQPRMQIIELCLKFVSCYNIFTTLCMHHAGSHCAGKQKGS